MKKLIYLFFVSFAALSFSSCEESGTEALGTSFASFESSKLDVGVEIGSETTKTIKVYTTNITGSNRTIDVMVESTSTADAGAYTVPATVTIPSGTNEGSLTVGVKDVGLSEDKSLVLRLKGSDNLSTGATLAINLSQLCPNSGIKLQMTLALDAYPEEGAWRIKDAAGVTVLASATPFAYGAYAGLSGSIVIKECLPAGTYTFQFYDQYGDGGTAYNITANGVLVYNVTGAAYTTGGTVSFTI